MDAKVVIAQRAAKFLKDGDVVNLGIGMPEMVANYLPEDVSIVFQSENGIMGMSSAAVEDDLNVSNAGGKYVTVIPASVLGILQARKLEWIAISFSSACK